MATLRRTNINTSTVPALTKLYIGKLALLILLIVLGILSAQLSSQLFNNDIILPTQGDVITPIAIHTTATKNESMIQDAQSSAQQAPQEVEVTLTLEQKVPRSNFTINKAYLQHLQTLPPFPKKLHILFPHKDYYKQHPDLNFVKYGILRFIKLNPTWEVHIYNDEDMDNIIRKAAADNIISKKELLQLVGDSSGYNLPSAHPVERADLARMLIIWYHGGLYADADSLINPRNFDNVFFPDEYTTVTSSITTTSIKICLPVYLDVNFAQSIVCSSPGNNLYMKMIRSMSQIRMTSNNGKPIERRDGWASTNSLFSMGPPLYNRIVFRTLFNEEISGHGDIPGIVSAMNQLKNEVPNVIVTGQYIDQCHSFLSTNYDGCKGWDRSELYDVYNMTSWSKAVKKRWGL